MVTDTQQTSDREISHNLILINSVIGFVFLNVLLFYVMCTGFFIETMTVPPVSDAMLLLQGYDTILKYLGIFFAIRIVPVLIGMFYVFIVLIIFLIGLHVWRSRYK